MHSHGCEDSASPWSYGKICPRIDCKAPEVVGSRCAVSVRGGMYEILAEKERWF